LYSTLKRAELYALKRYFSSLEADSTGIVTASQVQNLEFKPQSAKKKKVYSYYELSYYESSFLICVCAARDQTQDLTQLREMLYH
jgi:hypothetical protein